MRRIRDIASGKQIGRNLIITWGKYVVIRLGGANGPNLSKHPRVSQARRELFEYLRRSPEERAERRMPIDDSVFYERFVQDPVRRRSFGKCVFCENAPSGEEIVDHFRPYRDARDLRERVDQDIYAWLTYEFENLILICMNCAHKKGTFFPVVRGRAPYLASLAEIRRLENPLLLDPYRDRVDQHFDFLFDGWCEPLSYRGQVTVSLVDLNRDQLIKDRAFEIKHFFYELRTVIKNRKPIASIRDLFHSHLSFSGARLNVLRRLLQGLTFQGRVISGKPSSLPFHLVEAMRDISETDLQRLLQRFEDLPLEDQERERWNGSLGVEAEPNYDAEASIWGSVNRNGGLAHISINDFKGIGAMEFSIPSRSASRSAPCLMLVGENAVGKSSVLQAIALALLGGVEARKLRLDPVDFLRSEADA